jgi:hypothetical protein
MSRAVFFLVSNAIRSHVKELIDKLPHDARVEMKMPKRTIPQNDRMWAMLTDVSRQVKHLGRVYRPETWKALFMADMGQQCQFVPALDGSTVIPLGYRSSDLGVAEMAELITAIEEYGVRHGVIFHEPKIEGAA